MNMLLRASYINPPQFYDFILFRVVIPTKVGTCPPWQIAGALRQIRPRKTRKRKVRRNFWGIS